MKKRPAVLRKALPSLLVFVAVFLESGSVEAGTFTGPTSPYYLDNADTQTIYVVQGTSVIRSFPWAYSAKEGNLAVTNRVTTNGFGSDFGLGSAGQYTLNGVPTGLSHAAQATPGFNFEVQDDGTSDGRSNYTVQYFATDSRGAAVENVIRTDANWQNPVPLFSVPSAPGFLGISYDRNNNSLWLSGWATKTISDYSLSGKLLSSFSTDSITMDALGFDRADNTLWVSLAETDFLEQWSTSGVLLQTGVPTGLPSFHYFAGDFAEGVPEPIALSVFGAGLVGAVVMRRPRSQHRSAFVLRRA